MSDADIWGYDQESDPTEGERDYYKQRVGELEEFLASIHDFAVGNGDVCEVIARRIRRTLDGPKE